MLAVDDSPLRQSTPCVTYLLIAPKSKLRDDMVARISAAATQKAHAINFQVRTIDHLPFEKVRSKPRPRIDYLIIMLDPVTIDFAWLRSQFTKISFEYFIGRTSLVVVTKEDPSQLSTGLIHEIDEMEDLYDLAIHYCDTEDAQSTATVIAQLLRLGELAVQYQSDHTPLTLKCADLICVTETRLM
jgi:hypothetical protein